MKNLLIVFEGIDGVGKTTISKELNCVLLKSGIASVRYEDYEKKNEGFNLIKSFVIEHASIDSSLFFYVASAIYKSQIVSSLLQNQWVICDRYVYSTLAYHKARGANLNLLPLLNQLPIILPDFYFMLRVDEKVRKKRAIEKQDKELIDFQSKTRGSFFDQVEKCFIKYKPIILDNSQLSVNDLIKSVFKIIGV